MTDYAVGDLQGCYKTLKKLLGMADFSASRDRLWLVGDLVNRGPHSLKTLRFVAGLEHSAIVTLGNHDFHLLTQLCKKPPRKPNCTLRQVMKAPDRDPLLHWLRHQRLAHYDPDLGYMMTHSGVPPLWNTLECLAHAVEVERALQGPNYLSFLEQLYGDKPDIWSDDLSGMDRLRCIVNYLTRMRFVSAECRLDFSAKGAVTANPPGYMPWFRLPRKDDRVDLLFGHWAALGGVTGVRGIHALDTGCLWGNCLTLMNLQTKERISVPTIDKC
jgi:bis(5'-nucleosyl)-tetraphosphatase (symmetrical)